jgi:type II restriction enzyme
MLETNQKVFEDIEGRYYFTPIKKNFEKKVKEVGAEKAISFLTEIMQSSTAEVEKLYKSVLKVVK